MIRGQRADWEYVPEGWTRARPPEVKGWDVEAVARMYERRWPAFLAALKAPSPVAVSLEVPKSWGERVASGDPGTQQDAMSFGYVLARAAHNAASVSVLDWGGGVGQYFAIARALLPEIELAYRCRELPAVCARGRALVPEVDFVTDDSCLEEQYDLVFASSSLHYAEDWASLAQRLAGAARRWLYLARVPVVHSARSFVTLQRAHEYGYDTAYLGWVLNRTELVDRLEGTGMRLEREFVDVPEATIPKAPEQIQGAGFLFVRDHS